MDRYRKNDIGVGEKGVILIAKTNTQGLILVSFLIVLALFPKDADTDHILLQFIGASKMGSREKTQTPAVDLQRLVNGELH